MEKKNTGLIITIIVLVICVLGMGGFIIYDKLINNNNNKELIENYNANETQNESDNETLEVDKATLEELKLIANLDDCEYGSDYILEEGIINDFDDTEKGYIVFSYAQRKGLETEVSGEEYEFCEAGAGFCQAIKITDYDEILKVYGMEKFNDDNIADTYKDMYLYTYGGTCDNYHVKHNIDAIYVGDDIVLTDNASISYDGCVGEINDYSVEKTETREYTFKKNSEGEYYLYSIYKI